VTKFRLEVKGEACNRGSEVSFETFIMSSAINVERSLDRKRIFPYLTLVVQNVEMMKQI
jgi:hypothetical protein